MTVMSEKKTYPGIEIAGTSLILGLTGESLLGVTPWGVGAFIWFSALGLTGFGLVKRWTPQYSGNENRLLIPIMLIAAFFAWRDATMLNISACLALCAGLALRMQLAQHHLLSLESIPDKWLKMYSIGFRAFRGFPLYLAGVVQNALGARLDKETVKAILRGLILALPCLIVFGLLLAAADSGFAGWMADMLFFDLSDMPLKMLLIFLFTWMAGAYLSGTLTKLNLPDRANAGDRLSRRLGLMEVGIVLGLVDLLFGVFVVFQLGYLFGGTEFIQQVSGLTLAEYARRGFFEMVTVSALALPVLLGLKRVFEPANTSQKTSFNALAGVQIALLMLMLVSAGQRMALYIDSYGWTELRLYSSAFMSWMMFVLGWFVWTALPGNTQRFSMGSVIAGLVVIFGLHVANPDAVIVRSNLARAKAGKSFDLLYAAGLSADAVPALIEALPALPPKERSQISGSLIERWMSEDDTAWTGWNRSRHRARKAVRDAAGELSRYTAITQR